MPSGQFAKLETPQVECSYYKPGCHNSSLPGTVKMGDCGASQDQSTPSRRCFGRSRFGTRHALSQGVTGTRQTKQRSVKDARADTESEPEDSNRRKRRHHHSAREGPVGPG